MQPLNSSTPKALSRCAAGSPRVLTTSQQCDRPPSRPTNQPKRMIASQWFFLILKITFQAATPSRTVVVPPWRPCATQYPQAEYPLPSTIMYSQSLSSELFGCSAKIRVSRRIYYRDGNFTHECRGSPEVGGRVVPLVNQEVRRC